MRTAILTLLSVTSTIAGNAVEAPRPSPPLTIERLAAPPFQLSQYRGKVVALAFIDTNCIHCQELTRLLVPLAREYALRGVQVLECAFNDDANQAMAGFLKRFQPSFPVGWANRAAVMSYLQRTILDTTPLYVPHMVFLDRRGIIRADFPGESGFFKDPATSIRTELEKLLKAAAK